MLCRFSLCLALPRKRNRKDTGPRVGRPLLLTGHPAEARAILGSLAGRPDAPVRAINNLGIAQAVAGDRAAALATLAGRISMEDLDILQAGFGVPPPGSAQATPGAALVRERESEANPRVRPYAIALEREEPSAETSSRHEGLRRNDAPRD